MRKPFIAGNWKMNTNAKSAAALAEGLTKAFDPAVYANVDVAVCPPFAYLLTTANALKAGKVALGAQNVYFQPDGAFTGETSCAMLKDCCCEYVIIGHSERRHILGETDEMINRKIKAALAAGLKPIFAVGELLEERQAEKTNQVVETQIRNGLVDITAEQMKMITIAYEPVWAIGTGLNATPGQAQAVHAMIRDLIESMYSKAVSDAIRIQYGGSAKASNAAELLGQPDVDGLLVGGASLKVEEFAAIVKAAVN